MRNLPVSFAMPEIDQEPYLHLKNAIHDCLIFGVFFSVCIKIIAYWLPVTRRSPIYTDSLTTRLIGCTKSIKRDISTNAFDISTA